MKNKNPIISYIAIAVSCICLICLLVPWLHIRLIDVNYVISVLSILVTTLIGWNIYQLVDFDKKTKVLEQKYKELDDRIADSKENEHLLGETIHSSLSVDYMTRIVKVYGIEYYFLLHKIRAIIHCSYLGHFGECNKHIQEVFIVKDKIKNSFVSKNEKSALKDDLTKVSLPENIFGWSELVELVNNLKCIDE